MDKKTYELKNLKSLEEYKKELINIYSELKTAFLTDKFTQSDMNLLTRSDELVIIIEFIKKEIEKRENNDCNRNV